MKRVEVPVLWTVWMLLIACEEPEADAEAETYCVVSGTLVDQRWREDGRLVREELRSNGTVIGRSDFLYEGDLLVEEVFYGDGDGDEVTGRTLYTWDQGRLVATDTFDGTMSELDASVRLTWDGDRVVRLRRETVDNLEYEEHDFVWDGDDAVVTLTTKFRDDERVFTDQELHSYSFAADIPWPELSSYFHLPGGVRVRRETDYDVDGLPDPDGLRHETELDEDGWPTIERTWTGLGDEYVSVWGDCP